MAYEGFLSLGGTEIANAARTVAYTHELVPMLDIKDCWGCTDLAEVLGHDPYTNPMIDRPDWLSDHDPDSWDFCGLLPLEIEGLDDGVREATVTELSLDGAVVGAPRYRSREIRVTGLLIGASPAAVTYGLTWLAKALEGAPCREGIGCTGDHLCFYSACPPMCTDSPALDTWPNNPDPIPRHHESLFYLCDGGLIETAARACSVDYERTLYQVTTTSGPTIVERYNSICGSYVKVEFTMVAGVPFAFSTAISAIPGLEPVPDPQIAPEIACTPGSDVVVRTNLATNPIPIGNATGTGDGWLADGTMFDASPDTEISRLPGDQSVRVTRNTVTDSPNLAPNPDPVDTLDGWSWRLGQANPGPARTQLVENPWPRLPDGWEYNVPGDQPGTIVANNYVTVPRPTAQALPWNYQNGTGEVSASTGVTGASDGPTLDDGTQVTSYLRRTITTAKTAGNSGFYYRSPVGAIAADGGDTLAGGIYVRSSVDTTIAISIQNRSGASAGTGTIVPFTLVAGQWTRLTAVDEAEVAADGFQIWARLDPTEILPAGATVDVTAASLDLSTVVGPFFDGDTADTDMYAFEWTGEAGASASTQTVLDSNPYTAPMDVVDDDLGPDGELGFVRHTQEVADNHAWTVTYSGDQVLADGVTYTVSTYFRSTSERQVEFVGRMFDVPGYGWVRLTGQYVGTGTVPTLTIAGTGQATGEVIDVARALAEEGTALGTYFDGSSPAADGYTFAWTGEADASTSTATLGAPQVTTTLETGDGPGEQTTFQRTTIVVPKAGSEDGAAYVMDAGEGLYTFTMDVRPSVGVSVALRVSALDANGTVLTSQSADELTVPADVWTTLGAVRLAAPAGTARLQVVALMPGGDVLPAGATFDAAAVRVVDGLFLTDPVIGRVTYVGQHDNAATTIDVTAGGVYTASLYAGANVGSLATLSMRFYNASGAPVGVLRRGVGVELDAWTIPIGVAEWHRPSVTATAPTGAASAVVTIEVRKVASGAVLGDAAWITSLLFEQAGDVLSYFDGSTTDTDRVSYEWSGTANASTSQALLAIPAEPSPILDPDCPVVPAPPRPPVIDISCVETPSQWRRYVVDVGADLVPEWRDAVPIIRMQTGATAVRQVRVRFYPNPLVAPLQALNPCDYCGEFVITYIPPRSLMTIDGIRQWVTVTNSRTGDQVAANHLLASSDGGPVEWPVLGCGVAYTLVVDVSPIAVADLQPQICLAARS